MTKKFFRIISIIIVVAVFCACVNIFKEASTITEEEYWKEKDSLSVYSGESLRLVKEGIRNLLDTDTSKVEDLYLKVSRPIAPPFFIYATVLFKDKTVARYDVYLDAWGITNVSLGNSICSSYTYQEYLDGDFEYYEDYGFTDTITVNREWIINTEHYGAWVPQEAFENPEHLEFWLEDIPDEIAIEFPSEVFFATVEFTLDGSDIRIQPK